MRREIAIDEASFGPDHLAVASKLNNLAGLYRDQRDYAEADKLYRRSLKIRSICRTTIPKYVSHSTTSRACAQRR